MAGLDDLISQIPIADIAKKVGADQGEVAQTIQQLVPALVGGLQVNVQDDNIDSSKLEAAVSNHACGFEGGPSAGQRRAAASTASARASSTRSRRRDSARSRAMRRPHSSRTTRSSVSAGMDQNGSMTGEICRS